MTIRAIFFDLGGTLLDVPPYQAYIPDFLRTVLPDPSIVEQLAEHWEAAGRELIKQSNDREFRTLKEIKEETFLQILNLADLDPSSLDLDAIFRAGDAYHNRVILDSDLFPEVRETLAALAPRYHLGIISDADSEVVTGVLARQQLASLFGTVVASSTVGVYKPDRRIFEVALDHAGCEGDQALYIGDAAVDIIGADRIGMQSILVHRNTGTAPPRTGTATPTHTVADLSDLAALAATME